MARSEWVELPLRLVPNAQHGVCWVNVEKAIALGWESGERMDHQSR